MIRRHYSLRSAIAALCLTLVGCACRGQAAPVGQGPGPGKAAGTSGKVLRQLSADWSQIVVDSKKTVVVNNVWNKGAAQGPYQQTIFEEQADSGPVMGWTWKWPATGAPVVAYPEIVYGEKPWDGPRGLVAEFPFHPGDKSIIVDYDIAMEATGVYNLAFEVWPVSAVPGTKDTIVGEVMFWIAQGGDTLSPAGMIKGSIAVGGTTFDMYVNNQHGDISGANSNTWPYIAFAARTPMLKGPLDLGAFFNYMLQEGLLKKEHWITGLELGNELQTGTGVTRIRDFKVTIK